MRLLMVHDRFQPFGGSEHSVRVQVSGLIERGHTVVLATTAEQASLGSADPRLGGARWRAIPSGPGLRSARRTAGRIDVLARESGADLIEIGNVYGLLGPTGALHLARRRRVVRACRDTRSTCPRLDRIMPTGSLCRKPPGAICRRRGCLAPRGRSKGARARLDTCLWIRALRRAGAVTVESGAIRDLLVRLGIPGRRIHLLPLDVERFDPEPRPPSDARPIVLAPGVLGNPSKGLDHLLQAFARVRHPGARLRLTGEFGEAWDRVRGALGGPGRADRIDALGWLSPGSLHNELAACRVVAFPSRFLESFGLVGAEAAAAGRPVVAVDCGGSREWIVDGETGTLVDRDDPGAMARALDHYLDDPAAADAHGAAGRSMVRKRFTREANLDAITRVYEEVLAG